jgi:hypothetical protein
VLACTREAVVTACVPKALAQPPPVCALVHLQSTRPSMARNSMNFRDRLRRISSSVPVQPVKETGVWKALTYGANVDIHDVVSDRVCLSVCLSFAHLQRQRGHT